MVSANAKEASDIMQVLQVDQEQTLQSCLPLLNKGEQEQIVADLHVIGRIGCHPCAVRCSCSVGVVQVGCIHMADLHPDLRAVVPLDRGADQLVGKVMQFAPGKIAVKASEIEISVNIDRGILCSEVCINNRSAAALHIRDQCDLTGEFITRNQEVHQINFSIHRLHLCIAVSFLLFPIFKADFVDLFKVENKDAGLTTEGQNLSGQIVGILRCIRSDQRAALCIFLRIRSLCNSSFYFLNRNIQIKFPIPSFH